MRYQESGHHSLGSSTNVGVRVGVSMRACKYAVSASRRIAENPCRAARATELAGALLKSSKRSAADVPVFVLKLFPWNTIRAFHCSVFDGVSKLFALDA